MCKTGLKCCVSKDSYGNLEAKPLNFITRDRNATTVSSDTALTSNQTHTTVSANYGTSTSIAAAVATTPTKLSTPTKMCYGECVNGLLALFCDDIDSNAVCPGEDSCCITNAAGNSVPLSTTTFYSTYTSPPRTTASQLSAYGALTTTGIVSTTTTPHSFASNLPKCPGFCLLNLMAAFCERPAVIIAQTSTCKKGSVCCDNTKSGNNHQSKPHSTLMTTTTTSSTTVPPPPDPRPECPGSCIVPYLSFTCFRK